MKKLFIVLVVCIIVVASVFFITRNKGIANNNELDVAKNFDVYEALKYNANLNNVCVDVESNSITSGTYCKKDNMLKQTYSDNSTVMLIDAVTTDITIYNMDDKTGAIYKNMATEGEYIFIYNSYYNIMLEDKELYDYKVEIDSINGKTCFKVVFACKEPNRRYDQFFWFDMQTKLLMKYQNDRINAETYDLFKNIKLNTLTDEDMKVPSDIKLEEVKLF